MSRRSFAPATHRNPKNHIQALRVLGEVFPASEAKQAPAAEPPDGPMDLDILTLEAEAMRAHGIPQNLIPRPDYFGFDTGHPIPGGGAA